MSTDENKAIVLGCIDEVWNKRRLAILNKLVDPDLVDHSVPPGLPTTREGVEQFATLCWRALPDLHLTIDDQIAEDDRVATRWTARGTYVRQPLGGPPTGTAVVVTGIRIDRLLHGRIVETWAEVDQPGVLQRLEAIFKTCASW